MEKASLLGQWKDKKKAEGVSNAIEKAPDGALIPLSHGQRRLWFLQQLYPGNAFYNYSEKFRFVGDVQWPQLLHALTLVFENHDILRTVYYSEDGQPMMRILPEPGIVVSEYDIRNSEEAGEVAVERIFKADAKHSFDLSEPPVALVTVIRTRNNEHLVMLTLHHIAMDKWSMNLLGSQWASYYRELVEGEVPQPVAPKVQYLDYAYWQGHQPLKSGSLEYWKSKLAGDIPILDLPTDFVKPRQTTFAGRSSEVRLFPIITSEAVLRSCRQLGVTPYVFFLSVYYLFLYRYTGQKDLLIGSPISNRDQKQLEDTIGFFNDTIVLRTKIPHQGTFLDVLREVKKTTLEAFSNKEVPFDTLVRELKQQRSLSVNPFFQVMFLYYSVAETASFGEGLQVASEFYNPGVSKFDLTLDVAEENGRLSFAFEYSSELFAPETIARFQDHIALLVERVVAAPNTPVSGFELLTASEKELLLPEKTTSPHAFNEFTGIHQCIERMAEIRPKATAVTFDEEHMTYGELNAKAHALAVRILEKTGGSNTVIGLSVERSLDMVVGLLAILKSGSAYLPIDPKYPAERIAFMMADADIEILVAQKQLSSLFDSSEAHCLFVEDAETGSDVSDIEMPLPKKDDLAYVIYTSGSTGKPKGVPITHSNILNSTAARLAFYPDTPKAFLLLSSISFDSSKAGIFWTLCTGGNLIVSKDRIEQDMFALGNTIAQNGVTHMLLLPTLYQLVLEHADRDSLKSLTTIMVAGEACPAALVDDHFETLPEADLYNEYGPTEATVWCIAHKIGPGDTKGSVPLGRPMAHSQVLLLDAAMNLVPMGATGEIYIGGAGLSNGYLNRPDLTLAAFVDNPFSDEAGDKLYKTGDIARYNADGDLVFLGRSDQQIKIRGYRVELQEIEKAIQNYDQFEMVIVQAESEENNSKRLAAYFTADHPIDIATLRNFLKEKVPEYMVPQWLTQVDQMPLLPNGKIDHGALQALKRVGISEEDTERKHPRNELELKLHLIWQEVLQLDTIGVDDNFFALGGDSILSIQFIAKARKEGIHLTPNQIFDNQTIAGLAQYLSDKEKQIEEWDYLVALRKSGHEKPLFCIHAGGGHVFFYNVLTKYIGAHRPIYALQASGVYAGMEMHHSIETMAKDYLQAIRSVQPSGPYNIMVYCFSVAVGHEMVIQLTRAGETANLIVMDTMTDPWKLDTGDRLRMRIKSFAKRLFASPIKTVRGMVQERIIQIKLKMRQKMAKGDDKTLAELNANLARICEKYNWRPHHEKVTVLLTDKPDAGINKEVIGSWKKVALGGVQIVPVKGDHIDLFAEPEVEAVAGKIDEHCI
ncbi:MAG: amino acid adenylation domain-containing protein [Pricia sp.]